VEQRLVVLVNGMPAAGKTTLARQLARELRLPMLSKDVIKEAHGQVFGARPPDGRSHLEWSRMFGAAANATMWALLAESECGAVLESTWPADEAWEFARDGLRSARAGSPRQIWCDVPVEVAHERYMLRCPSRHAIHHDLSSEHEWRTRWARAEPLPLPATIRVDTTRPVDVARLAAWCANP
jgi:predicted kinase